MLIIVGAGDEFVPAIRGAKKSVIADAAHTAPYEKPEETFRILDNFLKS
jgi:pimeloyl-ACP methyl ester carboxylesterase